jgi:predicted AlkP superfamily phosphohydrolase/phosphomutase
MPSSATPQTIMSPGVYDTLSASLGMEYPLETEVTGKPKSSWDMLTAKKKDIWKKVTAAKLLTQEYDLEILIVVFRATDSLAHRWWENAQLMERVYCECDQAIGDLLQLTNDQSIKLIASDHGFGAFEHMFYVNEWLRQAGFLALRGKEGAKARDSQRAVSASPSVRTWLAKNREKKWLQSLARFTPSFVRQRIKPLVTMKPFHDADIDWSRTMAYGYGSRSIFINLKGRDPQGIVTSGPEYQRVKGQLIAGLGKIRIPGTKRPLTTDIFDKAEVFVGPHLEYAPDLIYYMDEGKDSNRFGSSKIVVKQRKLGHRRKGILIVSSDQIRANATIEASILDVLPTLFHHLRVPMPDDIDGRVLFDLFREDSPLRKAQVLQQPLESFQEKLLPTEQPIQMSDREQEEILERLRDLGYLG